MTTFFIRRPEDPAKVLLLRGLIAAYELACYDAVEVISDEAVLEPILSGLAVQVVHPTPTLTSLRSAQPGEGEAPKPGEECLAVGEDGLINVTSAKPEVIEAVEGGKKLGGGRKQVEPQPCKECGTMTGKRSGYCSNRCYLKAYKSGRHIPSKRGKDRDGPARRTEATVIVEPEGHNAEHLARSSGTIKGHKLG